MTSQTSLACALSPSILNGLKSLYDLINGESDANGIVADMMLEQAKTLPFMQKKR